MSKFIYTKQYRQFEEFCKACHRDRYIGLCYGVAGVGKTESAKHYTKWYQIESYRDANGRLNTSVKPRIQISKLNTILYTPSVLNPPRDMVREIRHSQREFSLLKERYIYAEEIPEHAREENKNFVDLVIIDEVEGFMITAKQILFLLVCQELISCFSVFLNYIQELALFIALKNSKRQR